MNVFKELLGEAITDETAQKMSEILDTKISDALSESQEQVLVLESDATGLEAEIVTLREQAEKYGQHIAESVKSEMQEEVDALTESLATAQQEKIDLIAEQAAYIVELKEQANLYGEQLVEATKEELKESVEATIQEYKEQQEAKFAAIDEDSRMRTVFANLKSLIETSGFTVDEDTEHLQLKSEITEQKQKIAELEESFDALQREKAIVEMSIDLPVTEQERFKKIAENIKSTSFDEFKQVLNVLAETAPKKVSTVAESQLELDSVVTLEEEIQKINESTITAKKSRLL